MQRSMIIPHMWLRVSHEPLLANALPALFELIDGAVRVAVALPFGS